MIFYRTFSFTGNNDYIFYTRFYCFLHNIFDCRSITIGNISFGIALVADKKCVPKPAAGIIAFLTFFIRNHLFHLFCNFNIFHMLFKHNQSIELPNCPSFIKTNSLMDYLRIQNYAFCVRTPVLKSSRNRFTLCRLG